MVNSRTRNKTNAYMDYVCSENVKKIRGVFFSIFFCRRLCFLPPTICMCVSVMVSCGKKKICDMSDF